MRRARPRSHDGCRARDRGALRCRSPSRVGAVAGAAAAARARNRNAGEAVTGAFEGWYYRTGRQHHLLVGYFNRNPKQGSTSRSGPNNRIEPGGPDYGQPTHFLPRRQWGVFTITVPKDFGDKKLTWTIVANGQTTSDPA